MQFVFTFLFFNRKFKNFLQKVNDCCHFEKKEDMETKQTYFPTAYNTTLWSFEAKRSVCARML